MNLDDSMPEILKKNGVYTHLVSDHQHYWEDGGATYHTRYSSWEISRGQEGDPWKADLGYKFNKNTVFVHKKDMLSYPPYQAMLSQDELNRRTMNTEEKTSQAVTFSNGLKLLKPTMIRTTGSFRLKPLILMNLFIPCLRIKLYIPIILPAMWIWMPTGRLTCRWQNQETVAHVRYNYAALVSKCDRYLGKVLDIMDRYNMWKDTMLIVNTDHGFLLGEHGWWGKTAMPIYDEIAHTPLFIYDTQDAATRWEYAEMPLFKRWIWRLHCWNFLDRKFLKICWDILWGR